MNRPHSSLHPSILRHRVHTQQRPAPPGPATRNLPGTHTPPDGRPSPRPPDGREFSRHPGTIIAPSPFSKPNDPNRHLPGSAIQKPHRSRSKALNRLLRPCKDLAIPYRSACPASLQPALIEDLPPYTPQSKAILAALPRGAGSNSDDMAGEAALCLLLAAPRALGHTQPRILPHRPTIDQPNRITKPASREGRKRPSPQTTGEDPFPGGGRPPQHHTRHHQGKQPAIIQSRQELGHRTAAKD